MNNFLAFFLFVSVIKNHSFVKIKKLPTITTATVKWQKIYFFLVEVYRTHPHTHPLKQHSINGIKNNIRIYIYTQRLRERERDEERILGDNTNIHTHTFAGHFKSCRRICCYPFVKDVCYIYVYVYTHVFFIFWQ